MDAKYITTSLKIMEAAKMIASLDKAKPHELLKDLANQLVRVNTSLLDYAAGATVPRNTGTTKK